MTDWSSLFATTGFTVLEEPGGALDWESLSTAEYAPLALAADPFTTVDDEFDDEFDPITAPRSPRRSIGARR